MHEGAHRPNSPNSRGQLGFDFLVGMSVFLIAVAFVIGFVPGMFDPFASESGADIIIADRSAAHLSGNTLVESPSKPSVLNTTCTVVFFSGVTIPDGCRFDTQELSSALGVDDAVSLNVTIQNGASIRSVNGEPLKSGRTPTVLDDVSVAQRVVHLDGESSRLYVRVW